MNKVYLVMYIDMAGCRDVCAIYADESMAAAYAHERNADFGPGWELSRFKVIEWDVQPACAPKVGA